MENNLTWICPKCQSIFRDDDLIENYDGLCPYDEVPLQPLEAEGDNFPYHCFNSNNESCDGIAQELHNMIKNIKTCGQDDTWHSIELLKNPLDRIEERKLFFQALKQLGKKFELKED